MDDLLENIFLVTSTLGFLLSLALITYIFKPYKANFFLGLIILFISMQLLFSWGSHSGYNNSPVAFPFWIFLTYYIPPPSIWLFTKSIFDQSFKAKRWHALLFMPTFAEILIHASFKLGMIPYQINLMDYQAWIWFIDYIPLSLLILSLGFFWNKYFNISKPNGFKLGKDARISHVKSVLFMCVLSLICVLWLCFTFIGWEYFSIIEFLLVFLLLVISFLIFLDSQSFPLLGMIGSENSFSHYDDHKQLKRLDHVFLMNDTMQSESNLRWNTEEKEFIYLPFIVDQLRIYRIEKGLSFKQSIRKTMLDLKKEFMP